MNFKNHCEESKKKFGVDWACVHAWLDEYAKIYYPSKIHRSHRHHVKGVEQVRGLWGDEAAEAAKQHILLDMEDMGVKEIPSEDWWNEWITREYGKQGV